MECMFENVPRKSLLPGQAGAVIAVCPGGPCGPPTGLRTSALTAVSGLRWTLAASQSRTQSGLVLLNVGEVAGEGLEPRLL